jgi:hypothetical protein
VDRAPRDRSARRRQPRRRRAGRATLVSERLYVAGLVVPAVALLIALVGLHAPAGIDLAPDAPPTFNADRALTLAGAIADVPVRQAFTDVGASPQIDTFTAPGRDGEPVTMSNVVSILKGESNEAIVVLAHRDNLPPGADEANSALGTAVVVELAAAFADQRNARTLVLASVDGGRAGSSACRAP